MKTEKRNVIAGLPAYRHRLPLTAHLKGSGVIGFVNRLPEPLATLKSVLTFAIKNGDMVCSQIGVPTDQPVTEILEKIAENLNCDNAEHRMYGHNALQELGQYVTFGVIFGMKSAVQHDATTPELTPQLVQRTLVAPTRPGLVAMNEGKLVAARWQHGAFRLFADTIIHASLDGLDENIQAVHEANCRLADTRPRHPGRRLRDLHRD